MFWRVLILAALLGGLLPLDPDAGLTAPALAASPGAYPQDLPWRFYLLLKAAIPWVPLGLLAGLPGRSGGWPHVLLLAGLTGLALVALPMQPQAHFRDVIEILALLPGLAAGYWLGRRSRLPGETGTSARPAAADEGVSPVRRPGPAPRSGGALPESAGLAGIRSAPHQAPSPAFAGSMDSAAAIPADTAIESPEAAAPRHGHRSRRGSGRSDDPPAWAGLALGAGGLVLLGLALAALLDFPRWQLAIGLGLLVYMAVLWFRPPAWLLVVPAALPLLDLAPWTGRFFLDEFDLLMLVTAGVLFLRDRTGHGPPARPLSRALFGLLAVSVLISGVVGLSPLPPLDANAFTSYWSPYNSLRLAKGFLWGALIYLWVRRAHLDRHDLARHLAIGMGLGLAGVGLVGAWEHGLFVGFEGRGETYRIVGTFSSMHTGGGHIEAYLVAALPFLWLATTRFRHLALTGPLAVLTAYVMLYTVARGGVLALAVVVLILALASGRLARGGNGRRFLVPVGMLAVVGLLLAAGVGGGYFQKRFSESGQDWQTRMDHWARAVDMMDGTARAQLFGMGLGSFPGRYLERGPADTQPATFGFAGEEGNTYFRLGSGATIYYAQRVPFAAGRNYRLELDARARQDHARLDTPVCEKQLLNSRQCAWMGFDVPGDGRWRRLTREFSSAGVGARDWPWRPPVELSLNNAGKVGVLDVDNVRLLDPEGRDLLCNGDFSRGGDCWFFKTHSHLPWHIKNVWVHVLFEQGWLGLLAFAGLTVLAVRRLARAGWRGHRLAWAWLASLAGLLTVGLFDSLLDAPRLATLLVALLLLGAGYRWGDGGGPRGARGRAERR
jgi:hypothetical protein